jgi:putative hydrolase of the HAD superfamily
MIDIIGFDADDTLWYSETLYARAQGQFETLLSRYSQGDGVLQALYETEMRNLPLYGYGIKSFALSMIETAVRLTDGSMKGADVLAILHIAREMLEAPVELLDGVAEVIPALAGRCTLMLITKGDLQDQEIKLRRSGLASHFSLVEIVYDKSVEIYRSLLEGHGIPPERFLMVGNSLRSDVLPVVELGGHAVHIPFDITWQHEQVAMPDAMLARYSELAHIGLLPPVVERLCEAKLQA